MKKLIIIVAAITLISCSKNEEDLPIPIIQEVVPYNNHHNFEGDYKLDYIIYGEPSLLTNVDLTTAKIGDSYTKIDGSNGVLTGYVAINSMVFSRLFHSQDDDGYIYQLNGKWNKSEGLNYYYSSINVGSSSSPDFYSTSWWLGFTLLYDIPTHMIVLMANGQEIYYYKKM